MGNFFLQIVQFLYTLKWIHELLTFQPPRVCCAAVDLHEELPLQVQRLWPRLPLGVRPGLRRRWQNLQQSGEKCNDRFETTTI